MPACYLQLVAFAAAQFLYKINLLNTGSGDWQSITEVPQICHGYASLSHNKLLAFFSVHIRYDWMA
jgi:hypothetical protein